MCSIDVVASNDVIGSINPGNFPVYYNNTNDNVNAEFECLSIRDRREMTEILEKLK